MNDKTKAVTEKMRAICSRREYCTADIRARLIKALDGDAKEVESVLESLVSDRYVDDFRYSSAYARDKSVISGWGKTKIRYMLSAKGIDRETISLALEEIDKDKSENRLLKLLDNKAKTLSDDPQCRMKLLRFALGRGYSYDEALSAITQVLK